MKHLLLSLLFVFSAVSAQESKVGTIDIDYILGLMPELSAVQEQVTAYQTELSEGYAEKLSTYEKALQNYRDNESLLTLMQKKTKEDSLMVMQN